MKKFESFKDLEKIDESGTFKTSNAIQSELKSFLTDVVVKKSRGYVKDERDAAGLLIDILKHLYNF